MLRPSAGSAVTLFKGKDLGGSTVNSVASPTPPSCEKFLAEATIGGELGHDVVDFCKKKETELEEYFFLLKENPPEALKLFKQLSTRYDALLKRLENQIPVLSAMKNSEEAISDIQGAINEVKKFQQGLKSASGMLETPIHPGDIPVTVIPPIDSQEETAPTRIRKRKTFVAEENISDQNPAQVKQIPKQSFFKPNYNSGNCPQEPKQKPKLNVNRNMQGNMQTLHDLEMIDLLEKAIVAHDPADHKELGISKEEYNVMSSRFKEIVRNNLVYAANPEVLKMVLRSKEHTVVVRPAKIMNGGSYNAEKNWVMIGMDEHMSENMIQNILRNEYFHAGLARTKDNPETESSLNNNDVEKLDAAILAGRKRITTYERAFKKYQSDKAKNSATKPPAFLQEFLDAAICYRSFDWREYKNIEEHEKFMRNQYQKIEDGRWLVPAGKYHITGMKNIIKGVQTTDDLYVTILTVDDNTMLYDFSHLKDCTVDSRASAFFADFNLRERVDYQRGSYLFQDRAHKTENYGSDIAQLPTNLKELIYHEYCGFGNERHGIKNYGQITALTAGC